MSTMADAKLKRIWSLEELIYEMGGRVIERMSNQLKIKTHQGKLVMLDLPWGGPAPTKEENDSDISASDTESLDSEMVGEECQDTRGYGADFFK